MGSVTAEDQALLRVMEVATLCSVPMALKAAIQLHVMDILARHGGAADDEPADHAQHNYLSALQIASHFKDHSIAITTSLQEAASSLDRILRVLASHGLLSSASLTTDLASQAMSSTAVRTYGLNALSRYLLQTQADEGSLAPFVLLIQDPVLMQPFYGLHESVIDGTVPFTKVHGMKVFSYTEKDARFDQLFNSAMLAHTHLLMQALLQNYHGFDNICSLVDVGGGAGASLSMIISKHPHIKGINFDQPHVIATAPKIPDVEYIGGDMFTSIPKGEAIFMKWILHCWSDEHCLKILENCYKALPQKGRVIIVDAILPVEVEHELGVRAMYQMDLLMYAFNEGGKERTKEELESISKAVGFSRVQLICNIHGCSVIEIFKEDP